MKDSATQVLIDNISFWLQTVIVAGTTMRVVYCLIRIKTSEDEMPMYKKRIKNTIIFLIISQLIFVID
jgi:predicted PolB exonuclease-like 3'-5' exonuclease